ncbi:hypothetical protein LOTGIDRAFT_63027, partial [Lottia gigantea]
CPECGLKFGTSVEVDRHLRQHTGEDTMDTNLPNTNNDDSELYRTTRMNPNVVSDKGKKSFACSKCSKVFYYKKSLMNHLKAHKDAEYRCEFCPSTFTLKRYLNEHKKIIVSQQQKTFTCDFCQKNFISVEEYSTHCKNCTIRCTCPFCGTTFQAMKVLRRHIKHTNLPEKIHKCDECGSSLSNFHNLKRHKKIHAKTKTVVKHEAETSGNLADKKKTGRFRCGICGDYFNHLFNLERHAMKHSEATPYQCQVCFTRFSEFQHLQCHF